MKRFTVELIVSNQFGVLNRITALYAKRGYNIDGLNVNEIENTSRSRMLITSTGDEYVQTQVVRQLNKLYDVQNVILMSQIN